METDLQKFLEELRSRISIVDVVASKVKLTHKGREWLGLCPFHNEKTPSFTVNEAKGFYHCFGCGAHGDIVKFEMDANNLPFIEAVKKLANKVGMKLPEMSRESAAEAQKKATLYDIMDFAAGFFERNLRLQEGQTALDYLYGRGFNDDTIKKFRMGYASANNSLKAYLISKGIEQKDLVDLGLVAIPEDKSRSPHDFFRNRVMIPIMDRQGRVIAFGGRIMDNSQPKYLNSPETPIFNKRRTLYNMNYAREKSYNAKRLIVSEGYMDVIAMDKYGFDYAVAPLGTALTENQIMEAWKVCPEPTLCFDGDNAGIKAAIRSIDRGLPILKAGYSLKYVFLPDKMDPDEFLKAKGKDAFEKFLSEPMPLVDLLWKKNVDGKNIATPEDKALFQKTIMEEIALIKDETVRSYYQQEIKKRIYEKFGQGSWRKPYTPAAKPVPQKRNTGAVINDAVLRFILAALIVHPKLIGEYEEKLMMFNVRNAGLNNLLSLILDYAQTEEDKDIIEYLAENGYKNIQDKLWEIAMIKAHNFMPAKLKSEMDRKIIEVQLEQLDKDIRECTNQLSKEFSDEVYIRFQTLKKEQAALLEMQQEE